MTGIATAPVVTAITRASVETTTELLSSHGFCPPPTAHVLSRHLDLPYIGSVTTRPFYRGTDAAAAVAALGRLPSLLYATQLVVTWEHVDLAVALELPGAARMPNALVVIDARLDEHVLGWHPFDLRIGPVGPSGLPTGTPDWGEPASYPDAPLPEPVTELLAIWRNWQRGDVRAEAQSMEAEGFRVMWAQPL